MPIDDKEKIKAYWLNSAEVEQIRDEFIAKHITGKSDEAQKSAWEGFTNKGFHIMTYSGERAGGFRYSTTTLHDTFKDVAKHRKSMEEQGYVLMHPRRASDLTTRIFD